MPILVIGLILLVLCIGFSVIYLTKTGKEVNLEKKELNIVIFVLSLLSFFISLKLFWNMGVYADEYGSSPVLVSGGWFWLCMNWARLGLLLVICVISGIKLFTTGKENNKEKY